MKTKNGFTLIELLIVVAVISILAAVALPNYNAYVVRGKLAEGASALSDGRVKMEQYFQDNRRYDSAAALAANGCPTITIPLPATTTYFSYSCGNLSATTYTLTATGTGSLAEFVYTINENNAKTTTGAPAGWGAAAMPAPCWITRKGGVC